MSKGEKIIDTINEITQRLRRGEPKKKIRRQHFELYKESDLEHDPRPGF